jgi:hypothetical protein
MGNETAENSTIFETKKIMLLQLALVRFPIRGSPGRSAPVMEDDRVFLDVMNRHHAISRANSENTNYSVGGWITKCVRPVWMSCGEIRDFRDVTVHLEK